MNTNIFREYDIRGIADSDLTDEVVENIGRAYGTLAFRTLEKDDITIVVGNDMRLSSARLLDALCRGITSTGVNVKTLGMVPTPLVYFAKYVDGVDGCIQITGSHNPGDYNGFKMMLGKETLHGPTIQTLLGLIQSADFKTGEGSIGERPEIISDYLTWIGENISLGERRPKVVVDCGNGVAGVCAIELVRDVLGCETVPLFVEPDGNFPNHHPDPTVPKNLVHLIAAVKEHKADFGVAYDGDGDRIGVVDQNGDILFGDMLMVILSRAVLAENPGAKIIGEVKCSQHLFDDIEKHGGSPIMSKVGHSLIKAKIKETGAKLAGEVSGHIFYNDRFFGFDDALYTTARVIEIYSNRDSEFSTFLDGIPEAYATPEIRIECADEKKFDVPKRVAEKFSDRYEVNTIDGVRINFGDGWGLCRASNTQPALVVRVEASTESRRDELQTEITNAIVAVS